MLPFDHPDAADHEAVHFLRDAASGLEAIIAIHSTALGPAAGGCRLWRYPNRDDALGDALRLAEGMSYKNALAGLPLGGGKAVILAPASIGDRSALFAAFGRAVNALGGRYITAEDVGTRVDDMKAVARSTAYVSGIGADGRSVGGDPSPHTARGVFLAMREAWRWLGGSESLEGVRVAVQGLGGVGRHLGQLLHEAGAQLTVSDIDPVRAQYARSQFGATVIEPQAILASDVDIVAPCALGGIIDAAAIARMRCVLVCGAANNQLATLADADALVDRGILFAPDFVVNSGGIMSVAAEYLRASDADELQRQIESIPLTLRRVLQAAQDNRQSTVAAARDMAQHLLAAAAPKATQVA
ncbi:MAG: Glu/Leu/Phe/Val dehydrogenase dimerization domain-containing protein [Steroidobacteraceae bacterium]